MRNDKTNLLGIWSLFTVLVLFAGNSYASAFGGKEENTYSGGVIYNSGGGAIGSYCVGTPTGGKYESASYSGSSGCSSYTPDTDSDGDTMDDTWETTYTLNKYNAADRYADGDSDGCTNACEKARGGAPNDTDSDNDGTTDMDDADPDNAGSSSLDLNSTYKGRKVTNTNVAE